MFTAVQNMAEMDRSLSGDQTCLCLDTDVTPEILEKAKSELGETPEKRQEAMKTLKRLINGEKDFRPVMDENFLLRFLRTKKFDPEKAFATLKNYYTFKLRYSKTLTDFKPSELKHVLELNMMTVLPYRHTTGCVVAASSIGLFDTTKAEIDEVFATALIMVESILDSEVTQICGAIALIDLKGISLSLIRQVASPRLLYRLVRVVQDCLPARIKAVHIINEPYYFTLVFSILKRLLSEKLNKRIQFHGKNLANLHKEVPPSILPNEFGGVLGPLESLDYNDDLIKKDDIFEKYSKYGFQEKRAQFIRKKSSRFFGLYA